MKYPEKFEDDEDEEENDGEGINLPAPGDFSQEIVEEAKDNESLTDVDIAYPLVPADPDDGEIVYAWAHITWEEDEGELIYKIVEPELDRQTREAYEKIIEIMERSFDINFDNLESDKAKKYLEEKIDLIVDKYNINVPEDKREVIRYYTKRDFAGLGKLQPLMNDTEVEDISCDGLDIPVYAYHRNPRFGSIKTYITSIEDD